MSAPVADSESAACPELWVHERRGCKPKGGLEATVSDKGGLTTQYESDGP